MRNVLGSTTPEDRLDNESGLRITETRIATLSSVIQDRKTRDIEYAKAYDRVEDIMAELRSSIGSELKAVYSSDPQLADLAADLIASNVNDTYQDILVEDFRDALSRFLSQGTTDRGQS